MDSHLRIVAKSSTVLLAVPLVLSAITHLWNPVGFPPIHWDEHTYLVRTDYLYEGLGPERHTFEYDAPFFGWIFMGTILKVLGYFSSLNSSSISMISTGSLFLIPRIVMGIIAVVDTLLVYKIAERRYNPIIAFIASVLFAVMPLTWMTRRFMLEPIEIPFILTSILLATYISNDITKTNSISRGRNIALDRFVTNTKTNSSRGVYISLLSGTALGIAIFTKLPAFTMIPVVAYLVYLNCRKNRKIQVLWFIPVIFIPLLYPIYALYNNEFNILILEFVNTRPNPPGHPTFFLQQASTIFFGIDPVIILLGLAGSVLAAVKRDFIFLLWIVPFAVFWLAPNYASDFHFLILFPPLCIASSVLIYKLALLFKKQMFKIILTILVLSVGIYGILNTALIISSDTAYGYYKAMAGVEKQIQNNNSSGIVTISGQELFSKPIHDKNINYIEGTFMFDRAPSAIDAGIVWNDGDYEYYLYLSPSSSTLVLFSVPYLNFRLGGIIQQSQVNYQNGVWYTLKIVYNSKTMNIFLNNNLKIQMPTTSPANIWRVGIRSHSEPSIAKFEPLRIGTTTPIHVLQQAYYIPLISRVLDYNNDNYPLLNESQLSGSKSIVTLKGDKILWSSLDAIRYDLIDGKNYIEDTFRVVSLSGTSQIDNHAGIVWIDGSNNKEYYVFLRSNDLTLYGQDEGEIASMPVDRHIGGWYTLKVLYANSTISVFLNDTPKITYLVPHNAYISQVGVRSYNTVAEFKPIIISKVSVPPPLQFHDQVKSRTVQYNLLDFTDTTLAQYP